MKKEIAIILIALIVLAGVILTGVPAIASALEADVGSVILAAGVLLIIGFVAPVFMSRREFSSVSRDPARFWWSAVGMGILSATLFFGVRRLVEGGTPVLFPLPEICVAVSGLLVYAASGRLTGVIDDLRNRNSSYRSQNIRYEKTVREMSKASESSLNETGIELNRLASQIVQIKDFARQLGSTTDAAEIKKIIRENGEKLIDAQKSAFLVALEIQPGGDAELALDGGILGWNETEVATILKNRPKPLQQVVAEKRLYVRVRDRDHNLTSLASSDPLRTGFILPITHSERLFGILLLSGPDEVESNHAGALLTILGELGGIALENAEFVKRIHEQATKDGLTGLHNHRYFQDYLSMKLEECDSVSVILTDIDHFKRFNDTHGHQTGDAVLKRVASICHDVIAAEVGSIPADALVARYGGEEFVIVLPEVGPAKAASAAEKVRECLETSVLEHEGVEHRITMSLGVARGSDLEQKNDLIQSADEALYESKEQGRNRVTIGAALVTSIAKTSAAVGG